MATKSNLPRGSGHTDCKIDDQVPDREAPEHDGEWKPGKDDIRKWKPKKRRRLSQVFGSDIISDKKHSLASATQQAVWSVWSYTKRHADSLDSERHCKCIEGLVEVALKDAKTINSLQMEEMKLLREDVKKAKASNKELTKELQDLYDEISELRRELERCKDEQMEERKRKEEEKKREADKKKAEALWSGRKGIVQYPLKPLASVPQQDKPRHRR